jgi:hypothetical protein
LFCPKDDANDDPHSPEIPCSKVSMVILNGDLNWLHSQYEEITAMHVVVPTIRKMRDAYDKAVI